jgi:hypothetical protein
MARWKNSISKRQKPKKRLPDGAYQIVGGEHDGKVVTLSHCVNGHPYCPLWFNDDDSLLDTEAHPYDGYDDMEREEVDPCMQLCSEPGCGTFHCECGFEVRAVESPAG